MQLGGIAHAVSSRVGTGSATSSSGLPEPRKIGADEQEDLVDHLAQLARQRAAGEHEDRPAGRLDDAGDVRGADDLRVRVGRVVAAGDHVLGQRVRDVRELEVGLPKVVEMRLRLPAASRSRINVPMPGP